MDLDTASMELAKSVGNLPPKLRYRFKRFIQKLVHTHGDQAAGPERVEKMAKEMTKMMQELMGTPLAKNESRFSTYDNGCVRLDFGEDVPDRVKKAAMNWAKSRGLSAVEASLTKSLKGPEYVIMSPSRGVMPSELSQVVSNHF